MGKELVRAKVLEDLLGERERQDKKWGDQVGNSDFEWMSILGEEYGEVCHDVNEACFRDDKPKDMTKAYIELIQTAAVAFAHAEALRRRKVVNG